MSASLDAVDVAISWDPATNSGDWTISNGDLALGNPLQSAVLISLFTDRLAPEEVAGDAAQVGIQPQSDGDRRGWWGDAFDDRKTLIGSRLWQVQRAIKANATSVPRVIEAFCNEALQWLKDDGVASAVSTSAAWAPGSRTRVDFVVTVTQPTQSSAEQFKFSLVWEGLV